MENNEPAFFKTARSFLQGDTAPDADELLTLVDKLAGENRFDYARRLLANYRRDVRAGKRSGPPEPDKARKLAHKHSLYTYKDPDLPAPDRLDLGLGILNEADPLAHSLDQETLGQAGAIHKRKWELYGDRRHLETSLRFYERACKRGIWRNDGYTAVNAAFVHDLLAEQAAAESGTDAPDALQHRRDADAIRAHVIRVLTAKKARRPAAEPADLKWLYASLSEALFGLARYAEAGEALASFVEASPNPWEKDTAARQLGRLFFLRNAGAVPPQEARDALSVLGATPEAIESTFVGKVGLALSGGGFRASLFHLGVLACLAEMHLLRYVEVLSCVSGGSIVGAHYYLALQKRLESTEDGALTQGDYVKVVEEVAEQFLRGVQKNLRMRLLINPYTSLKIALWPGYSHTDLVGELFERHLYHDAGPTKAKRRWMDELEMFRGREGGFNPRRDNWRRADKVPVLVLNATALNTGHNWQFAATWMGEPAADLGRGVDTNDWLRRLPYGKAPDRHRRVRLGFAVAASACVPAMFRPLELRELYSGWKVRLADGGVHDNQGVATLLEQECTVLLVSDASGQSPSNKHPGSDMLAVSLRANDILMGRVRQEQHRRLAALQAVGRIRGLMFIHLRRGLEPYPVNWKGCDEDARHFLDYDPAAAAKQNGTGGVPHTIQRLLAGIRTDLDTFCDVEAYALITSGYRQTQQDLPATLRRFATVQPAPERWFFLKVEELFSPAGEPTGEPVKLTAVLKQARHRAFKPFRIYKGLLAIPLALVAWVLTFAYQTYPRWSTTALRIPTRWIAAFAVVALILAGLGRLGEGRLKNLAMSIPRALLWIVLAVVAPLLVGAGLLTLDRLYLWRGRMGLKGPHHTKGR